MARSSSPARSMETEMDISLDASSIQDPVQAKLEELMAIARTNSEQLKRLLEEPKSRRGPKPKKTKVTKPCSVSGFILY